MTKAWRCIICGHIHQGETPPDVCPVCHADASKFVLEEPASAGAGDPEKEGAQGLLQEMLHSFMPHAVCAHFPNALIPVMALFLGLFLFFGGNSFETTGFYLLAVGVIVVPPTLATGLYAWRKDYAGEPAPIFRKKIRLALILLVLGAAALTWRWLQPRVLLDGGSASWLFLLLVVAMLACVTLLGHYGGMLAFARCGFKKAGQEGQE